MKSHNAELLLALVTVIWGGTFLFTKIGLQYTNFSFYMILRFTVAFTASLLVFGRYYKSFDKKVFKAGLVLGLLFGVGFIFQTLGLKFTAVSNSAFITGLTVPLTPIVAYFILRKRFKYASLLGVLVAFTGLTIYTNPFQNSFNIGDLVTLISTLFWAFYITYMDVLTKEIKTYKQTSLIVVIQLFFCLLISVIVFFIFEFRDFYFIPSWNLVLSLGFNGILASLIVTFIQTSAQKFTTPVKAALIFSMEPIFASVFSAVLGLEFMTSIKIIGGSIMLMGIVVSEIGPNVIKYLKKS
jgi:drug/metabolite transporter (DMT)-like permease